MLEQLDMRFDPGRCPSYAGCYLYNFTLDPPQSSLTLADDTEIRLTTFSDVVRGMGLLGIGDSGEEGPFLIAESMDDPYIPKNIDDRTRSVIEGTIRPATYEGKNEKGFFLCDAVVFYSNALFIANFAVQPGGMIEMLDDEPIAADLSVKVGAPVS